MHIGIIAGRPQRCGTRTAAKRTTSGEELLCQEEFCCATWLHAGMQSMHSVEDAEAPTRAHRAEQGLQH